MFQINAIATEVDYKAKYAINPKDIFGFTTSCGIHLFAENGPYIVSFWAPDIAPVVDRYESVTLIDIIKELGICNPEEIESVLNSEKDYTATFTVRL